MKTMGLLLLVVAGLLLGLMAAGGLRRRVTSLDQLSRFMVRMADQIRYTAAPVEELLESAENSGEFADLPILGRICSKIRNGERVPDAWENAVEEDGRESGLTEGDRDLLRGFGSQFGRTDVEGQIANCRQYGDLLGQRLAEAREASAAKGRLYLTLGFAGGMSLALLLL